MKFLQDLGMQYATENSAKKSHFGLYECPDCGKPARTLIANVKNGSTKRCRPCGYKHSAKNNSVHGLSNNKIYHAFINMRGRCYNKNHKWYSYYGGSGIGICKQWLDSPESFVKWSLENGYKDNLSIDRIDNRKGYSPDNCRWTTPSVQSANQRKRSDNASGFVGVSRTDNGKWLARVEYKGEVIMDSRYESPIDAASARESFIKKNSLPHKLNFSTAQG